ncbi:MULTISPECIES: cobalamin biosynthesis protein [unclassified Streptomyces]|uniref:cobalamin biosynthesis protein n=1 Tax=Streptomyces TaxID=1883 RepID=UPI0004C63A26|nr:MULTISPECIES: cobalamin biosynthesis protein [unclassified Streptomyces]KPC93578.1 cobalamin biosynthesis protein CbiG [Streptomyces sp. NRRL F-6602]
MRPDGTHPGPRPGPRLVTVGIGSCAGVTAEEVHGLVTAVLATAGLAPGDVTALATVLARAAEPGLLAVSRRLALPLLAYDARALARVRVPHPSGFARTAVGTPSVAEAAALLAGGGGPGSLVQGGAPALLVPKTTSRPGDGAPARATAAVAALTVPGSDT